MLKTKKQPKRRPTVNQRRVIKRIAEDIRSGKKVSISRAMRESGYSPSTAATLRITTSKSWDALLEEYLPDLLLAQKAHENLKAVEIRHMEFGSNTTDQEIKEIISGKGFELKSIVKGFMGKKVAYYFKPDYDIVVRSLDQSYKLKAKYKPEHHIFERPLKDLSDEELEKLIEEGKKKFAK